MAKRKLSRHQAWRIQKIHDEKLKRAQKKAVKAEASEDGALGPEQAGLLIANFGPNFIVEADHGRTYRCVARANVPSLVCGDRIVWQPLGQMEGVIVAVTPRQSVLSRPDYSGQLKPVAANIDQILVVTASLPGIDTQSIDHYLVAAETLDITPVIVINKIDLLNDAERQELEQTLSFYAKIGYTTLYASTKTEHGLDALEARLVGRTSVLVGQSGVGKSSLIKALVPDIDIRIGALSAATGLGTHTTTTAMLYHLVHGGNLIDSPGVRQFGLWQLNASEVARGFVEFRPYLSQCKYRNCTHVNEPGCAVLAAVQDGAISAQRAQSYALIVKSLQQRY